MEKRTKTLMIIMLASFVIAIWWDSLPFIKNTVHFILDPTAGKLLNFNINLGMLLVVLVVTLLMSLIQKLTVDQETLRQLKKEQKLLREEMKKYKNHPEKLLELQKKQFEFIPKTMDITLRPLIYTSLPIILFFRWFSIYFSTIEPTKIFGIFSTNGVFLFPSWFWAYLIVSIIFTSIFRKIFNLA